MKEQGVASTFGSLRDLDTSTAFIALHGPSTAGFHASTNLRESKNQFVSIS